MGMGEFANIRVGRFGLLKTVNSFRKAENDFLELGILSDANESFDIPSVSL
jgi:hypothetical protein